MVQVVRGLLETRDDVYVRWLVPEWISEDSRAWLPDNPRIQYITIPIYKDRHKEYNYVHPEWLDSFMFRGDYWDTDIIITNRAPLVPLMRANLNRPRNPKWYWTRKVLVFEDMPVMSFKKSVPVGVEANQDILTIAGYLSADATAICAYWEKAEVLKIARKYYSPAMVKKLSDTIHESSPMHVESTWLKTTEFIKDKSTPFVLGFAGRMVNGHNFQAIFDVMAKHWILRNGKDRALECAISTVSKSDGVVDVPEFVKVLRLGREAFWDLMKNKVHVGIFMSPEEDYSLSLIEPLILGTPYVVYRCAWSEASLGKDYPFFCGNANEAYAIIREFYNNYSKQYAKFAEWSKVHFEPLLLGRNSVTHMSVVSSVITALDEEKRKFFEGEGGPKDVISLLLSIGEEQGGRINIVEAFKVLQKRKLVGNLGTKASKEFQERVSLSFSTDYNEFRVALEGHGYIDASVKTGDMIKK